MKKVISLLVAVVLVLTMIPFVVVPAAATEGGASDTGNAKTDAVLNDYGFDISLDKIEGYDEANGKVENTPFGSKYVEGYTLYEPFYATDFSRDLIEANSGTYGAENIPTGDINVPDVQSIVANGFITGDGSTSFSKGAFECVRTAAGDFDRDARKNGIAMICANVGINQTTIYLAVFDPADTTGTVSCVQLSAVSLYSWEAINDVFSLISISTGKVMPGNENAQKISPDEIVVTYPVENGGKIQMATAVFLLTSTNENAWKNMNNWTCANIVSADVSGRMLFTTVGDLDEDGFDDIIRITSFGVSQLKLDKKLNKKSNASVQVLYGGNMSRTAKAEISGLYRAGGAVTDINDDGKPNLVLCGMQDVTISSSSATITEYSVVLKSNLKASTSCTRSSKIGSSMLDTLEQTLRKLPVVIKTEQRSDDGSNRITGAKDDSYHSVMFDGMFVVAKTCTDQLFFAGDDREAYMKKDQVLVDAYSGMVYTNAPSVSRDEIFLIYSNGYATEYLYSHSKAKEFNRTVAGFNLSGSVGLSINFFALPNMDYDSGILRYEGWGIHFTDPSIKAILAAAPSFMDFYHIDTNYNLGGKTAYSFSSSVGNGLAAEWNLGVTAGTDVGVVKCSASGGYQGSWSRNWTETETVEFSASLETLVVVSTVPVEVYTYTLFVNKPGEGLVQYQYYVPVAHNEVYATMTVPEYDKTAVKYGKQTLTGNAVIHNDGDPASYTYTDEWITGKFGSDKTLVQDSDIMTGSNWMRTSYNTGTISSSIDIEQQDEQSHGIYFEFSISGGLIATGGVEGGGSVGIVLSEGKGESYTASVRNLLPQALEHGFGFQWRMKTFKAVVDGARIPFVTYEIKDCSTNPLMPINVSARGYEAYDEDGNRIPANKITWEEHPSNANLDVSYAIMRKHSFTGALQTIGTVPYGTTSFIDTKDLEFGTEYEYAVRTVKNKASSPNRYSVTSPVETAMTLSEYGAPVVSIPGSTVTTPVATPVTLNVYVDGDLTGRKIEYQWMRRDPQTKKWDYITDATDASFQIETVLYAMDGMEYRCVVMETIVKEDGKKEIIYCNSDVIKLCVV